MQVQGWIWGSIRILLEDTLRLFGIPWKDVTFSLFRTSLNLKFSCVFVSLQICFLFPDPSIWMGFSHEQKLQPVPRVLPTQGLSRCRHEHGEILETHKEQRMDHIFYTIFVTFIDDYYNCEFESLLSSPSRSVSPTSARAERTWNGTTKFTNAKFLS